MLTRSKTVCQSQVPTRRQVVLEARVVCGTGGGPDKTILNSPRFLTAAGYDTLCAYMHPPGDPGFDDLRAKADALGVALISIPDRGPWDWRVISSLLSICRRERVAIWHGHDYKSNALGLLLRQLWPMRLVTTLHGWVKHTQRTPLYYWIDEKCLPHYEAIICVSDDLFDRCLNVGVPSGRCRLIENGIDVEGFVRNSPVDRAKQTFGLTPRDLVVAAVGRLSAEKGFDVLIRAVRTLVENGLNIHLLIAGTGDAESQLRDLVSSLGLANRVRLLGHMTDPRPLYEAADVVALSSYREGLPNVLLEAMALEVPVVATRVNGVPRLVNHGVNGILVEPGSSHELANAINGLLGDAATRKRLAAEGRKTVVHHYSFATRMQKIRDVYDQLLGRN